jgi:ABC transport system ATP-binding/permease protein
MTPARAQLWVLADRYRAVMTGDLPTLALLVGQAPLIGWLCAIVWGSLETDTPSLWFVMALSAVWFGCINACREVVKERAIVERERLLGLSIPAYVGSKLLVLAALGLVQVVLLQFAVEWRISLRGPYLLETLALWMGSMSGAAMGLVVSAVAARQERAVGAVPLLLLPQILFSEFAVPEDRFTDIVSVVQKLMPVHWTFTVFEAAAAAEADWGEVAVALLVLPGTTVGLAAVAAALLLRRREV